MTTSVNANNVPRPSKIPIDEMIGSDDVSHNVNPTVDNMDAGTAMEKIFSLIVEVMAGIVSICFRLFV